MKRHQQALNRAYPLLNSTVFDSQWLLLSVFRYPIMWFLDNLNSWNATHSPHTVQVVPPTEAWPPYALITPEKSLCPPTLHDLASSRPPELWQWFFGSPRTRLITHMEEPSDTPARKTAIHPCGRAQWCQFYYCFSALFAEDSSPGAGSENVHFMPALYVSKISHRHQVEIDRITECTGFITAAHSAKLNKRCSDDCQWNWPCLLLWLSHNQASCDY